SAVALAVPPGDEHGVRSTVAQRVGDSDRVARLARLARTPSVQARLEVIAVDDARRRPFRLGGRARDRDVVDEERGRALSLDVEHQRAEPFWTGVRSPELHPGS